MNIPNTQYNVNSLSKDQVDFLLSAISHEHTKCDQLLELMLSEQILLEKRNIEAIPKLLKEKTTLINEIEKSAERRLQMFGLKAIHKHHNAVFEQHVNKVDRLAEPWQQLKHCLDRCRNQNEINGRIIELSQKSIDRTINLFKQSLRPNNLTTYSAKGFAQQTPIHITGVEA